MGRNFLQIGALRAKGFTMSFFAENGGGRGLIIGAWNWGDVSVRYLASLFDAEMVVVLVVFGAQIVARELF